MKQIAPDDYMRFACAKGDCRHTCCAGWEIDIDEESLKRYEALDGELGARMRRSIEHTNEGAFFRLSEEEKCPFLNSDGLCDLILELGASGLCQICSDHPRFRNYIADREEIGLGLCCEAAARLILGRKEPMRLMILADDGEMQTCFPEDAELLELRDRLMDIAQDRRVSTEERVNAILDRLQIELKPFSWKEWSRFLMDLEHMDEDWIRRLNALESEFAERDLTAYETVFEQLLVYLLYRHLPGALEDEDITGRIAYVVFAWRLVRALCMTVDKFNFEEIVEICRLYSSELEYSDENMNMIVDRLHMYNLTL